MREVLRCGKLRSYLLYNLIFPSDCSISGFAAYCQVSIEQEEQSSSIELQEQYYAWLISENPNWEAGLGLPGKAISPHCAMMG